LQTDIDHLMNIMANVQVGRLYSQGTGPHHVGICRHGPHQAEGLKTGIEKMKELRKEFETNLFIPGAKEGMNIELDKAFRLRDFITHG
jgi:succinate dehydrogenase / fumarate reductase flavoprotein subunit